MSFGWSGVDEFGEGVWFSWDVCFYLNTQTIARDKVIQMRSRKATPEAMIIIVKSY